MIKKEESATTPKSGFNLRSLANAHSDRMVLLSKPSKKIFPDLILRKKNPLLNLS